jgi:hypothetical protein
MAFFTAEHVAQTALALFEADLIHGALVNRQFETDYKGGTGRTITIRRPSTLQVRKRALGETTAITLDDINEQTDSVTIDEMAYSAVKVSDEDFTFSIEDFGRQVLAPQVQAIVRAAEDAVVTKMQAVPETTSIAYDAAAPSKTLYAMRKALRDLGVPAENMTALVGTQVAMDLLQEDVIQSSERSGSDNALRHAVVGKVAGSNVVESNAFADDEIVLFHRDAFSLVTVAPAVPEGVTFGAAQSHNGTALRYLRDYDPSILSDRSVVSTFLGCKSFQVDTVDLKGVVTRVTPALRVLGSTPVV